MPEVFLSMQSMTSARATVAALKRHKHPPAEIDDAMRDLRAARLAEFVAATVAKAPPLTAEQRSRIIALLGAA